MVYKMWLNTNTMINFTDTYDIVIKCNTEEQRDSVLDKVDELKNMPSDAVWHDAEGYHNGIRPNITNVFFKEDFKPFGHEREVI